MRAATLYFLPSEQVCTLAKYQVLLRDSVLLRGKCWFSVSLAAATPTGAKALKDREQKQLKSHQHTHVHRRVEKAPGLKAEACLFCVCDMEE